MISIRRTNASDQDFIKLVDALNADLAEKNGDTHQFYDQFNKLDAIKHVILVYENHTAVACGAMKMFNTDVMEIKRMYTAQEYRGKGYAQQVLTALENWAREMGYQTCVLETGIKQKEALGLYKKCAYKAIPNYGPYLDVSNSFCFEKLL